MSPSSAHQALASVRTPPPATPVVEPSWPRRAARRDATLAHLARTIVLPVALSLCSSACGAGAPLSPRAVELNRLGLEALDSGDLKVAEARFSLALEFHPRFVEAIVNLGLTELSRGNHERARALFSKARNLNADLPHPHHGLGVLASKTGQAAEASEHFREALRVDPGFAPARANLARSYFDAAMLEDAREQFLRLTEVAPRDDRGPAGLVETLLRLGRRREAREVLRAALERVGATPALRLLAARSRLEAGAIDEARAGLGALASVPSPVRASALAWLAIADLAANDPRAALAHAEAARALDGDDPTAAHAQRAATRALARQSTDGAAAR